ncbi:VOC family protein [Paenibacillus filicis]|uniref:VOC family protein n=1 Tax=Paenibacillus filicis TaxID=669464 RepID=A0ABU9DHU7_9BACL
MELAHPPIATFLMFDGQAEEAMNLYTSLFPDSKIISLTRYGPDEAGSEGTVQQASFSLNGQAFRCMDSSIKHDFTFTPSISIFVTFGTEEELDRVYAALSRDGKVLMPLAAYPFSEKFAWIADRFGVSWQLNLAQN